MDMMEGYSNYKLVILLDRFAGFPGSWVPATVSHADVDHSVSLLL